MTSEQNEQNTTNETTDSSAKPNANPAPGPLAKRLPLGAPGGERRHFTSRPTGPAAAQPIARPVRPVTPLPPRQSPAKPADAPASSAAPDDSTPAAATDTAVIPAATVDVSTAVSDAAPTESSPSPAPLSEAARAANPVPVPEGGAVTVGEKRERPPRGSGPKKKQPIVVAEQRLPPVVPKPSRRDALSPDLEAEMLAALGGQSLDTLLTTDSGKGGPTRELMELDSRRAATIVRVHGDNVFFTLDGRNEGVASSRQFRDPPEPGQQYDVIIKSFNADDGLYELLIPGASVEVADWSDIREGSVVEAKVTGANTGGLECEVNRLRGFIPISQIAIFRVEDTAEFVGQKMLCVVTEANPQRRNLVLSRRAMLEREKEDAKRAFYQEVQVGQIREGIVRKIEDFGAFVDLGGADGLIHLSQLSWERVKHPSDVLKEGQKVQVRIERFDPQTNKIGLSLRSLQEHPWTNITSRFPVGATARGPITRLANFGAFVKLAAGVEGLIHISELAHQRVNQVGSVVREGQEVEVKILTIDEENQRIGLSLKALSNAPPSAKSAEEAEEPLREPVIKKRPGPLKGGFDRPTGGEGLGLKW